MTPPHPLHGPWILRVFCLNRLTFRGQVNMPFQAWTMKLEVPGKTLSILLPLCVPLDRTNPGSFSSGSVIITLCVIDALNKHEVLPVRTKGVKSHGLLSSVSKPRGIRTVLPGISLSRAASCTAEIGTGTSPPSSMKATRLATSPAEPFATHSVKDFELEPCLLNLTGLTSHGGLTSAARCCDANTDHWTLFS